MADDRRPQHEDERGRGGPGDPGYNRWGDEVPDGPYPAGYGRAAFHGREQLFAARGRGPHAGKGPRGYRRSDERIREDVSDRLERDPDIDASDVEVVVAEGVVTVSGTVPDRRMKRLLEEVIEDCPGVRDVENHVRLSDGPGPPLAGRSAGGAAAAAAGGGGTGARVRAGTEGRAGTGGTPGTAGHERRRGEGRQEPEQERADERETRETRQATQARGGTEERGRTGSRAGAESGGRGASRRNTGSTGAAGRGRNR